jgi:ribosomal protein S8
MSITNKLKLLLSKIKIAQFSKKKKLKLKIISVDLFLLDILWKNGFIYGYNKLKLDYFIFLRYSLQGEGILDFTTFSDQQLSSKKLKRLLLLDSNYSYLVLTSKGTSIYSTMNSVNLGGKFIAKL